MGSCVIVPQSPLRFLNKNLQSLNPLKKRISPVLPSWLSELWLYLIEQQSSANSVVLLQVQQKPTNQLMLYSMFARNVKSCWVNRDKVQLVLWWLAS
jgi:hypothetical protein